MFYPKNCFSIREDVTRAARREYEKKAAVFTAECLRVDPGYYSRGLRERMEIRKKAEAVLGFSV